MLPLLLAVAASPTWDHYAFNGPGDRLMSAFCAEGFSRALQATPRALGLEVSGRSRNMQPMPAAEHRCELARRGAPVGYLTMRSTDCETAPKRFGSECARPVSITVDRKTTLVTWKPSR